jgi:hypothetical protein
MVQLAKLQQYMYLCNRHGSIKILVELCQLQQKKQSIFLQILRFCGFFKNACSTNILVLTGQQHQYIGAIQGEPKCWQHCPYSVKRGLFNLLEWSGNA